MEYYGVEKGGVKYGHEMFRKPPTRVLELVPHTKCR